MPGALALGLSTSAALALLTAAFNDGNLPLALAVGAAALLPTTAASWTLLVAPASLSGSTTKPEESIESSWYDRATRGAFHDMLIAAGLGLVALTVVPSLKELSASFALVILVAAVSIDVALRYRFLARREG